MKARFDAQAERREYRKGLISAWRTKLGESAHLPEDFGDSHEYASLRANMLEEVIKRYEAPRTLYVPGGRGKDVRKQMLLDEIARLEREWRLL
jgi:hypothetical protein